MAEIYSLHVIIRFAPTVLLPSLRFLVLVPNLHPLVFTWSAPPMLLSNLQHLGLLPNLCPLLLSPSLHSPPNPPMWLPDLHPLCCYPICSPWSVPLPNLYWYQIYIPLCKFLIRTHIFAWSTPPFCLPDLHQICTLCPYLICAPSWVVTWSTPVSYYPIYVLAFIFQSMSSMFLSKLYPLPCRCIYNLHLHPLSCYLIVPGVATWSGSPVLIPYLFLF